jgi:acetylglutamate kinase
VVRKLKTRLQRLGKKGEFVQGMRVTDAETMEVVEWVLAGEVQQDIVGLINQAGGKAVGLTGRDGGMIRAHQTEDAGRHRPQHRSRCRAGRRHRQHRPQCGESLARRRLHSRSSAPSVLARSNESYNINADVVAAKLATVLKAEKLVLLTNTEGVLDKAGKLLRDLPERSPN